MTTVYLVFIIKKLLDVFTVIIETTFPNLQYNKPRMNMIVNHLITRSSQMGALQVGRQAGHQIDTKTTRFEFKG